MSRISFPTPLAGASTVAVVHTGAGFDIDVTVAQHAGEPVITAGPYELDLDDAEALRLALSGAIHLVKTGQPTCAQPVVLTLAEAQSLQRLAAHANDCHPVDGKTRQRLAVLIAAATR